MLITYLGGLVHYCYFIEIYRYHLIGACIYWWYFYVKIVKVTVTANKLVRCSGKSWSEPVSLVLLTMQN